MIKSNNTIFNLGNIFLLVWFVYHLQNYILPLGYLSSLLFIFQIAVSVYCLFYANIHYDTPRTIKAVNVLVIIYFIYGLLRVMQGEQLIIEESGDIVLPMDFTRHYINSLLPIYVGFVLAKSGQITQSYIKFWCLAFLLFSTIEYTGVHQTLIEENTVQEEFTNNIGYQFLAIIPVIFLAYKNSIVRYPLLFIVIIFVISAMKRGAILIAVLSLIYIIYIELKKSSRSKAFLKIALVALVSIGIYKYTQYMLNTSDLFNLRIAQTIEGDSSSRDVLKEDIIHYLQYDSSVFELLFGKGADGTLKVTQNFAHNDWLEIVTNMGLLGIIVFIYFWISFIKDIFGSSNQEIKSVLTLIFIFCLSRTLFSMSITDMPIYTSYTLGICLAKYQNNEQN